MFGVIISKFMCGWKDVRCTFYVEPEFRLGTMSEIDDLRKLFYTNDGFFVCPCVKKFEPSEFEPCKNCNINYFCWSCVYPMYKMDEKEFKERCAYKKEILADIWK